MLNGLSGDQNRHHCWEAQNTSRHIAGSIGEGVTSLTGSWTLLSSLGSCRQLERSCIQESCQPRLTYVWTTNSSRMSYFNYLTPLSASSVRQVDCISCLFVKDSQQWNHDPGSDRQDSTSIRTSDRQKRQSQFRNLRRQNTQHLPGPAV